MGQLEIGFELVDAPEEIQKMVAPSPKIGVPREMGKIDWDTAVSITTKIKDKDREVQVARELSQKPIYRRDAREVISRVAKEPEKLVSAVVREVIETPYEMPFRLTHMQPIIDGVKTQTSRTGIADPKYKTRRYRTRCRLGAAFCSP